MRERRILFWGHADAVTGNGGEANYVTHLADELRARGNRVDVSTDWDIDLVPYKAVHFSNIHRVADAEHRLRRATSAGVAAIFTPVFLQPQAWVRQARSGWRRTLLGAVPLGLLETARAHAETLSIRRWGARPTRGTLFQSAWVRQRRILREAAQIWINSELEASVLMRHYRMRLPYRIVRFGGITEDEYRSLSPAPRPEWDVALVGYLAPVKNHVNMLEALAPLGLRGLLVGRMIPRHNEYGRRVLRLAREMGWQHVERLDHDSLLAALARTRVLVQASWFETCGMTALEALGVGAAAVVTTRGYGREYFQADAEYADPQDQRSIRDAVVRALERTPDLERARRVRQRIRWEASGAAAHSSLLELG